MKPSTYLKSALLAASGLTALTAMTPAAIAQETDEKRLSPVVVTATRVESDLQDVAGSVAALGGEKLDVLQSGGADIRFLSARVPSVYVESSFGRTFPRFYIRGLGNTDFDLNASQPVSLIVDDVVQENPILKGFPIFDVEGVEVLRGPQGTLFGRNTPAGIIKFDSVKPSQEFGGYARGSYGTYDTISLEGAVGGGVTDTISVRLSGKVQKRSDYIDNALTDGGSQYGGYTDIALRGQVLFEPTDTFSALLNVHGRDLDGTARLFRGNAIEPGTNDLAAGFDRETVFYDGGDGNPQDLQTYGGSLTLTYDLAEDLTLTSVTAYEGGEAFSRGDIDGGFGAVFLGEGNFGPGVIPFDAESADGVPALSQYSQEIRIASSYDSAFNWQAGAYFFAEDIKIETFNYESLAPGNPLDGYVLQHQNAEAWAVFASATYEFADKWTLAGGVRYTDDSKDYDVIRSIAPLAAPFLGGQGTTGLLTRSVGDEAVSWDASLTYAATEDVNLYARVATGFRSPAIQGRILFAFGDEGVSVAESETLTSFEAGVKAELLEGRVRTNLSAFYYEIEDQQLTAIGGETNANTLVNADKGVGQGFEFEVEALPTDNFLVTAGLSLNDTEIQDASLSVAPCGGGCTVTDALDGSGFALIDGNAFPNSPEWIGTVTGRYSWPVGADGEIYVYTDWNYRSEVNFFLYESVEFTEDAYWEGGLRVGVKPSGSDFEYAFFARNITDETRKTGGIDFNNLTAFVNEGRTFGIEVATTF